MYSSPGKVLVLRHQLPGLGQRSLVDHGRGAEIAVRGVEQGDAVGKRTIRQRLALDERLLEIARPMPDSFWRFGSAVTD
jgi:hypothetical protein